MTIVRFLFYCWNFRVFFLLRLDIVDGKLALVVSGFSGCEPARPAFAKSILRAGWRGASFLMRNGRGMPG